MFNQQFDEMYIVPLNIKRFEFDLKDYNFAKATEQSRLQLSIQLEEGLFADLKAAKENYDSLRDITLKYIKPSIQSQTNGAT